MRRRPECRQLLRVKSMMRYRPPKGTAGLALSAVNGCRREPAPPAKMMLIVLSSMRTFDQACPSLARFEQKFNRAPQKNGVVALFTYFCATAKQRLASLSAKIGK